MNGRGVFSYRPTITFLPLKTSHVGELWHKLCHIVSLTLLPIPQTYSQLQHLYYCYRLLPLSILWKVITKVVHFFWVLAKIFEGKKKLTILLAPFFDDFFFCGHLMIKSIIKKKKKKKKKEWLFLKIGSNLKFSNF